MKVYSLLILYAVNTEDSFFKQSLRVFDNREKALECFEDDIRRHYEEVNYVIDDDDVKKEDRFVSEARKSLCKNNAWCDENTENTYIIQCLDVE